jgi:hypothetical protein
MLLDVQVRDARMPLGRTDTRVTRLRNLNPDSPSDYVIVVNGWLYDASDESECENACASEFGQCPHDSARLPDAGPHAGLEREAVHSRECEISSSDPGLSPPALNHPEGQVALEHAGSLFDSDQPVLNHPETDRAGEGDRLCPFTSAFVWAGL